MDSINKCLQSCIRSKLCQLTTFLGVCVVHLVFQTYLEQNFEHLCKKTKFKNIFTTRKLKLVPKLESETDFKKNIRNIFLKEELLLYVSKASYWFQQTLQKHEVTKFNEPVKNKRIEELKLIHKSKICKTRTRIWKFLIGKRSSPLNSQCPLKEIIPL